jgi:hypothetical protein
MPILAQEPHTTLTVEEPDKVVVVEQHIEVVTIEQGPPGPKGDPGTGVPGPPGSPVTVFQDSPSTVWTIQHNLGRRVAAVQVYDTADTMYMGALEYVDDNTIKIHFSAAISGRVEVI